MKKLLGIVVLGLLWSNITFASFVHFNKWLYDNGHHQYLNLDEPTEGVCATEPKFSMIWYANSCYIFEGSNKRIDENNEFKPNNSYGLSKMIGMNI